MSARDILSGYTDIQKTKVIPLFKAREQKNGGGGDIQKIVNAFFRGVNSVMDKVQNMLKKGMSEDDLETIKRITDKMNTLDTGSDDDEDEIDDDEIED